MLSPFWRDISMFNPVLYMVNGFRYGILGVSDISPFSSFALLLVFITLLFGFAIYLLHKGTGLRE
jgi:ABC-2 type transport system permease protein